MINLTNSIKFLKTGNELSLSTLKAAKSTKKMLLTQYTGLESEIDLGLITSSNDNKYKSLAFNLYYPKIEHMMDERWLNKVFTLLNKNSYDALTKDNHGTISNLEININIPKALLYEFLRGLRIFFLALWAEEAILLPMNFDLPRSNRRNDIASSIYPEVLSIFRGVPCKRFPTFNIYSHVAEPTKNNFKWYAWRLVIASSWRSIEDISTTDLYDVFDFLSKLRQTPDPLILPGYPVTPQMFAGPLISAFKNDIKFDFSVVSLKQPLKSYSADMLDGELGISKEDTSNWSQKNAWLKIQRKYLDNQFHVKKITNIRPIERNIGRLNYYLFILLPQQGITPPLPEYLDRKYIDGVANIPPLREIMSQRDAMSATSRFFDFIEETETFLTQKQFTNPITRWDKPRGKSNSQTDKVPFKLNDFLLIYNLTNAVLDFAWYLFENILDGTAPSNWHKLLNSQNTSSIFTTTDFGMTPKIQYREINGSIISFDLKYIPVSVMPITHVDLHGRSGKITIPNIFGISETVIALDTGLRHSHIRWLDKHTFEHQTHGDNAPYFDMCVNTDKSGHSWIRPTSMIVHQTIKRLIKVQKHVNAEHFSKKLPYRNKDNTNYEPISPIFHLYQNNAVYSESSMRKYYNNLVYFFQQIKTQQRMNLREEMPAIIANLTFDRPEHFSLAEQHRDQFKSQYTPHGTRATVISASSLFLPIHIVASKISGHRGINDTLHYAVVDETFIGSSVRDVLSFTERTFNMVSSCTTRRQSPLRGALNDDTASHLSDHGATSFFSEKHDGRIIGGVDIIATDRSNIRLFTTHICPLGGQCPDDITSTIGPKKCGQCPYSVKALDHLPRILAHSRQLARELDELQLQIAFADTNGATEAVLEEFEDRIISVSCELSAWMLTAEVLINNRDMLKDKVMINRPDLLSDKIFVIAGSTDKLTETLLRFQDSVAYQDLINSTLELDVVRMKGKLLSFSNKVADLFPEDAEQDPIEQIRGVVKGISVLTGKSYEAIAHQLAQQPKVHHCQVNYGSLMHDA